MNVFRGRINLFLLSIFFPIVDLRMLWSFFLLVCFIVALFNIETNNFKSIHLKSVFEF